MSTREPKRPAGSFRAPSTNGAGNAAPQRRGMFGALLAPRSARTSSMPRITSSFARGFVAVVSSPGLLLSIPILLLAEWLGAVALGFQGPLTLFATGLAPAPVGTVFDQALSTNLFGQQRGLEFILAFVALRAVIMAILLAAVVQTLEEGKMSPGVALRGLRVLPTTLAVGILSMAFITFATILGGYLGLGISLLLWVASQVLSLYLFAFAPVMAVAERRSMPESLSRSMRAGRMPGAGNLTFAALYVIVSLVVLQVATRPYRLGVNPTFAAWAFVLVTGVLQVSVVATIAFRYLSISEEVPAAPEPRQRGARGRRG